MEELSSNCYYVKEFLLAVNIKIFTMKTKRKEERKEALRGKKIYSQIKINPSLLYHRYLGFH